MKYEYHSFVESEFNSKIKWSYKTNNESFIEDYKNSEPVSYYIDDYKELLDAIRVLIPRLEEMPKVLETGD